MTEIKNMDNEELLNELVSGDVRHFEEYREEILSRMQSSAALKAADELAEAQTAYWEAVEDAPLGADFDPDVEREHDRIIAALASYTAIREDG